MGWLEPQKFGLVVDDLTSAEVITSDKNTVNDYGRALALWSQMELSNDKTTSDIADILKNSITTGKNSDLSTLLQKVNNDNTIAIKNISKDDLKYVSDNLTDTTKPFLSNPPDLAAFTSSDGSKIFIYFDSLLSKNTAEVSAFKVLLTTLGTNGNADTTSDAVRAWAPCHENYTFTDEGGGTRLHVDLDAFGGYEDMMAKLWPPALDQLKRLCEGTN